MFSLNTSRGQMVQMEPLACSLGSPTMLIHAFSCHGHRLYFAHATTCRLGVFRDCSSSPSSSPSTAALVLFCPRRLLCDLVSLLPVLGPTSSSSCSSSSPPSLSTPMTTVPLPLPLSSNTMRNCLM